MGGSQERRKEKKPNLAEDQVDQNQSKESLVFKDLLKFNLSIFRDIYR